MKLVDKLVIEKQVEILAFRELFKHKLLNKIIEFKPGDGYINYCFYQPTPLFYQTLCEDLAGRTGRQQDMGSILRQATPGQASHYIECPKPGRKNKKCEYCPVIDDKRKG